MLTHMLSVLDMSPHAPSDTELPFVQQLITTQDADPDLAKRKANLDDTSLRPPAFVRADGVLMLDGKIAVPEDDAIKLRILRMKHDHPTAGHPGRTKTIQLVNRDYYWRKCKDFVTDYVNSCLRCARAKTPRRKPHGLLAPLPVAERPWSSLSMDYIDQLPRSGGFDAILVIACRFSKMALFIPTTTTATSQTLADSYIAHVFSKHGLPDDMVSDRGSKFVSKFWRTVTNKLGVKRNLSTAYHPQSDGQTERINQTLEQYLRMYCAYQQNDWHD